MDGFRQSTLKRNAMDQARNNMTCLAPHDLLWVPNQAALATVEPMPRWATAAWIALAPVVVRREHLDATGLVPVGLRGKQRNQRLRAYLDSTAGIHCCIKPEELARRQAWFEQPQQLQSPAISALMRIAPYLDRTGLVWGPTGSAGFTLASGISTLHAGSDLDIVVRCCRPFTQEQVDALHCALACSACKVDLQVDTGHGGFSFLEWTGKAGVVLLKTNFGPIFTNTPWDEPAGCNSRNRHVQ